MNISSILFVFFFFVYFKRPVVVAKRALSPDNEANSSVAKRKERRRRWDVLPNGVKLDAADEVEESINLKENRSNAVKLETLKGRTSGKTEKEQDADSNIVKAGKSTNRKDALRKLSFGTEEVRILFAFLFLI